METTAELWKHFRRNEEYAKNNRQRSQRYMGTKGDKGYQKQSNRGSLTREEQAFRGLIKKWKITTHDQGVSENWSLWSPWNGMGKEWHVY